MPGDPSPVPVTGTGPVQVSAHPAKYFDDPALKLYFKSPADHSIDQNGAKKYNKTANVPADYVLDVQNDLIALKYLTGTADGDFGASSKAAVERFQRHAKRVYRMPGPADVKPADVFQGKVTGEVDAATATEIRKWISNSWVLPLGRFKLVALKNATGKLREDAAAVWDKLITDAAAAGMTLADPYGNTQRNITTSGTPGSSKKSFHYSGRAVDINQGFAGGKDQRYYVQKETVGTDTFWRIWCRLADQTAKDGVEYTKGQIQFFSFWDEKEQDIKAGRYKDLTAFIEATGVFERISAQSGWDDQKNSKTVRNKKTEWWHFQYTVDKQETFLDEMELIGIGEAELKKNGWTDAELKGKPG